jgi:hypothetical protein
MLNIDMRTVLSIARRQKYCSATNFQIGVFVTEFLVKDYRRVGK